MRFVTFSNSNISLQLVSIVLQYEHGRYEAGLRQFNHLLGNKYFLLIFIRTLENCKEFVAREKVNVASLLSTALQNRMEYQTE
jgi:hypothetical protein